MVKITHEDTAIEYIRLFVKKWSGIIAVVGAGAGLFYQHKKGVDDLSLAIEQIREVLRDRDRQYAVDHAISVDGFADPRIRLALDAHIRTVLRSITADQDRSNRAWRQMLFDLNPTLNKPSE